MKQLQQMSILQTGLTLFFCGTKHPRPVGNRCIITLNVSAPNITEHQSSEEESNDSITQTRNAAQGDTSEPAVPQGGPQLSQMETKLEMILKKMQNLEHKNQALEQQFAAQEVATSSILSHSLPKRSHKCSKACPASAAKKRRARQRVQLHSLEESRDEDNSTMTHSSVHASRTLIPQSNFSSRITTHVRLRSNWRGFKDFHGRHLHNQGKSLKSGLQRAGDNDVKV